MRDTGRTATANLKVPVPVWLSRSSESSYHNIIMNHDSLGPLALRYQSLWYYRNYCALPRTSGLSSESIRKKKKLIISNGICLIKLAQSSTEFSGSDILSLPSFSLK